MLRSVLLASALLAVALLSGCLEFEQQEAAWGYDAEQDRFDVQLVYRGIYASEEMSPFSEGGDGVEDAGHQIDRILAGRRLFAMERSFPFGLDLDGLKERGTTLLVQALLDRIAIDQGDFFRDAEGRLCGWQRIRIRGFTGFVTLLDQLLRLSIVRPGDRADFFATFGLHAAASRARVARAIERAGSFLSHREGVLVLRVPATEEEARAWVARFEPQFATANLTRVDERARPGEEFQFIRTLEALRWIGAKAIATPDGIEITLVQPGRSPERARAAAKDEPTPDNVAPLLVDRGVVIRTDVTDESLAREFAAFRRF